MDAYVSGGTLNTPVLRRPTVPLLPYLRVITFTAAEAPRTLPSSHGSQDSADTCPSQGTLMGAVVT